MVFTTYPDGTQELCDHGLRVRVQRGRVQSATLTFGADQAPVKLNTDLGDPKHVGYQWQKRMLEKWGAQAAGTQPIIVDSGSFYWPGLLVGSQTAVAV